MKEKSKVLFQGIGYWLLASVVSSAFSLILIGYTYSTSKQELLYSSARLVKASPYQQDGLSAAQLMYQLLCSSSSVKDCSVRILQGDWLVASVPTVVNPDATLNSETILLDNFAPPLMAVVNFNFSSSALLRATGTATLVWFVAFGLFVLAHLRLSYVKQERELDHHRMRAELTRLAEQVAHDIRSPLSALRALAAIGTDNLEEKQDLLKSTIHRISGIAEELLDVSRKNRVSELPKIYDVDGADVRPSRSVPRIVEALPASKMLEVVEGSIAEKKAELAAAANPIRIHFASNMPEHLRDKSILFDEKKLRRILSNLLNNSIESIEGDGFISVDIEISEHESLIEIRDNGKGIPEDIQNRLFQRGSSSGKVNGNGFGLYSARQWLNDWSGRISIQSAPMRGTTVRLEFCAP